jgi:hypothetical protein
MKKLIWVVILAISLSSCAIPLFYVSDKNPSPCVECKTAIVNLKPANKAAKELCEFDEYFCNIELLVGKRNYPKGSIVSFKTLSDTTKFTNFFQEW